jgi:hypothetical protein
MMDISLPSGKPPSRTKAWAVAATLWIASNVFVTVVATMATWEGAATYKRMADLCRWDCTWYAKIVQFGYLNETLPTTGAASWPFHPLFPITAYPLHQWFNISLPGSIVLASKLELLLAIYAFLLLLSDQLETTADYFRAGSLVAFNPYLIYAHAGYAEPLYFALIALGFYFAGWRQWILAGAMGGVASATRILGSLFTFSYVTGWLKEQRWRLSFRKLSLTAVIGLLLCPLGTALFTLYLHSRIGDALAWEHAHVAWGKQPGSIVETLELCFTRPHWPPVWGVMILSAWLLSGWLFKLRKPELGIYLALVVLVAASTGYWAIARYIWWQPPFLYAIYRALRRHTGAWLIYTAFASSMAAFMVVEWFSGHNFVI